MKIEIEKLGSNGWYTFKNIPQEKNYGKIYIMNCGTERKAIFQAKRINPNHKYTIKEVKA